MLAWGCGQMTKQPYAGKPGGVRIIVPPSFRTYAAGVRRKAAEGHEYLAEGEVAEAVKRLRTAIQREREPTMQRLLFEDMMLLLPMCFREAVAHTIKKGKSDD